MGSRGWRGTLLSLCSTAFLSSLAMAVLSPVLSLYLAELGASKPQIGLFFTLYSLAWAPLQILTGYFADILGRRRLAAVGLVTYGFSSLGMVYSGSVGVATVSRVAQGIGLGLFGPAILGIAASIPERGKAFAFFRTSQVIAFVLGPVAGGLLGDMSMSYPFLISLFASIFSLIPLLVVKGGQAQGRPSPRRMLGLVRERDFLLLVLGTFLAECVFSSFDVVIPLFGDLSGWSKMEIGGVMASYFASFILTQIPLGYLADRVGKDRIILSSSLISGVVGALMLGSGSATWFAAMMALLGVSLGAIFVQSSAKAGDLAPADERSLYMAFFDSAIDLSFIIMPGPASIIFGRGPKLLFATWSALSLLSFLSFLGARSRYRAPH